MDEDYPWDWREITPPLYPKIRPTGGDLHHSIDIDYVSSIEIGLTLAPFDYVDPFYDDVSSPSEMALELHCKWQEFRTIFCLIDLKASNPGEKLYGSFSNSLSVVVSRFRFGPFVDGQVDFEMTYSLTNSDSYPSMSGTMEEHMSESATLSTRLDVQDLRLVIHNPKIQLASRLAELDQDIYAVEAAKPVKGSAGLAGGRRVFDIPLRWDAPKPTSPTPSGRESGWQRLVRRVVRRNIL